MPEDERFEDYVELENYIEALQAGQKAHPPTDLTPEKARIYQMAALFHAGTDDKAEPDPEFVERLKGQLLEVNEQATTIEPQAAPVPEQAAHDVPLIQSEAEQPVVPATSTIKRARFFSRRGLLSGGALAAASLVVGAGIGYEEHKNPTPKVSESYPPGSYPPATTQRLHISANTPTTWYFVTSLAELGNDAVRFTSETITGYVLRAPATSNSTENVVALSAACTHMGCLVQWRNTDRHFACPCHGALFGLQGAQMATGYAYKLPPLPSLNTKIEDGNVYVEIPR